MLTEEQVWQALQEVKDPEIPTISVVEMGMVHRVELTPREVLVEMIPTFVGCPALDLIRANVSERLLAIEGVNQVDVQFVFDPPWTSDRITPEGHEKLKQFGIAPPTVKPHQLPPCPYCGEEDGEVENLFGPTACRAIYYCKRCRQPFEGMKRI